MEKKTLQYILQIKNFTIYIYIYIYIYILVYSIYYLKNEIIMI